MKEWVTVLRAADAAARWHVHQRRKGSAQEPYINHLLEVASLVAEATHGKDPDLVIAALLHDAIEDQEVPRELIEREFGKRVADVVSQVTGSFTPPDGVLANLINGLAANNASESTDFANGLTNVIITFDFQPSGKKHVVVGIQWEQNNSTGQGTYDWEASNDNTNWTALKSNFSLVNGSSFNETTWASITAYRYHRLKQVGGSTSSSPWIHEIYFKCAPGAYAADSI